MKVWIAIVGYDYEWYAEPIGVFKPQKQAEKALIGERGDSKEVLPYTIGKKRQAQ